MKKIWIPLLVVAVLTGCTTAEHQVRKEVINGPVEGTETIESVNIHLSQAFFLSSHRDVVNLIRTTDVHGVSYMLEVQFSGGNWRFMEGPIKIEINDKISALDIEPPRREGGIGVVHETLHAILPPEVVKELFNSDDIWIQYWEQPIQLTTEEISYLRKLSPQQPK